MLRGRDFYDFFKRVLVLDIVFRRYFVFFFVVV